MQRLLKGGTYSRRGPSVCNFQSMKGSVELNSLSLKFFCYITWLLYQLIRRDAGRLANEALNVKSYCFLETIAKRFKNYKLSY